MPKPPPATDLFHHERDCRALGLAPVAGVDEAGRGPLAGPVVAAAVILPVGWVDTGLAPTLTGLTDSKKLSAQRRELFYEQLINDSSIHWAVVEIDAPTIDRINILQATWLAMRTALERLSVRPAFALVDGNPVAGLPCDHRAIVKGDSLSYSIAAASILAKVARDRHMMAMALRHPAYGFDRHKGYGTAYHLAALKANGPCALHRRTFAPVRQEQGELF